MAFPASKVIIILRLGRWKGWVEQAGRGGKRKTGRLRIDLSAHPLMAKSSGSCKIGEEHAQVDSDALSVTPSQFDPLSVLRFNVN
jgi:hypothetical protein